MALDLPKHLERYVVEQDYSRYTPVDQATWRHIMRQLKPFLSKHGHPCYQMGLERTGIEVEQIPHIEAMSEKLEKFGWRAMPVSGFIPPAAFMELQSLGILPIASDMRSVDHLLYTPAPDIVHEAAGHAPILVDPEFAAYLKAYALVARKAILSREDMDQYEAIRILSDLKEDPSSTATQIQTADARLTEVTKSITDISEAALLGRMNWWTAEYGLIGELNNPKIFGAGLLSSVGESRSCLGPSVKKIPLTLDCINFSYDITEKQPQLFVVEKFHRLGEVLEELAKTMGFRRGGTESLDKAIRARTVNTIVLDSGLQISGVLKSYLESAVAPGQPCYLSFSSPTQLALNGYEIHGQGVDHHRHGFGTPVGRAAIEFEGRRSSHFDLRSRAPRELEEAGLKANADIKLHFESGVVVDGRVQSLSTSMDGKLIVISFSKAKATQGESLLFDPEWGAYDMAVGTKVVSVFGGPADRHAYGEIDDFSKKLVPRRTYDASTIAKHGLYQGVRNFRLSNQKSDESLLEISRSAEIIAPNDWLVHCEILEQAIARADSAIKRTVVENVNRWLAAISKADAASAGHIADAFEAMSTKS